MSGLQEGFYRLVRSRRSIRSFQDEDVSDEVLRKMIEAACRAPSAHNRQPWRFVVMRKGPPRSALVEVMSERYRADQLADGVPPEEVEARSKVREERVLGAPVAILLCVSLEDVTRYPDPRRSTAERDMAVQSLALAGGHLLLAAHAEGLGACWIGAPVFAPQAAAEALDLPASWEPQGMIILGWPDSPGVDRARRTVDEVTEWR